MIVQRFNLNLIPNQSPVIVHVNQYDTGTGRLIATLYEGNEPYSPNGTAVIQGTKPDGHGFQYTATLDGNVVTADLTEQMSPVAGDVRVQIVVTESSGVTGTFVFIMRVQPSALPSDADMSESDYPLIEEAIREAQEAVERAEAAITETQENAENSEAWAQGTRGGIPVGPTDPTYEHNAEYWAQYAERYAQGGLHYKASIPFANIPTTGMREGDMYDITDDFTTDSRFTEGAGIKVKGGTNIAWNSDNKWDILALPYIPKTTFNGRSGSILPMAGDYSAEQVNYDSNQTVKQKIDALVTKEESDIAGQQSLLKDTVGWTGKNLLPYPYSSNAGTINGITITDNGDGSITMNGTATAGFDYQLRTREGITDTKNLEMYLNAGKEYIVSGNINVSGCRIDIGRANNGSWQTLCEVPTEAEQTFLVPVGNTTRIAVDIHISNGTKIENKTFYPMLRDASITDDTYEPYHESVEEELKQIYTDNGVLGAKNLLPYPYTETSLTRNGITFTVNSDGTVTVNGTATAEALFILHRYLIDIKLSGNFILNGCPTGGTNTTYQICLQRRNAENTGWDNPIYRDFGDGVNVTIENGRLFDVNILIRNGATLNNLVFKPMLRLASDPDDTYQPYAMTNRELTNKVNAVETDFTNDIDALKSYFGILTTPVPSYVANTLPVLKRNITSAFYNGSLRGEIAAGNFKNVRPGDYIIGQATGSTYYVAMCDYRLGKGDQTNNANYPAYGTHHLGLMLFKPVGTTALWRGYGSSSRSWRVSAADLGMCPWNAALDADPANTEAVGADNTNITRTYGSANVSGYMGSFIRERIDAILLPQCFQADFGSANVLKYREINGNTVATDKPSGGQGNWNGCTSGWGWYDRYLDLLSEVELYGSRIFGSGMDTGCQCEQLPLFRNAAIHDFYPRIDIWTKAVASSSAACTRAGDGIAGYSGASIARWACPLACVK